MRTNKTICLNSKVNGKQPSTSQRVYDVGGISMAITCSFLPSIAEPVSVAMRGRNPNNPSERCKSNGQYKQRIEMNKSGVANAITSVQKDSMVAEPQIIEVGRVKEGKHQQDSVQHEDGICRCICTGHHASTPHLLKTMVSEPQVLTPKRTEYGKAIRKQYEAHEIEMSRHDMTTMEPRTDGITNTLTSVQKDNYLAIPEATTKGYAEGCQQGVVEEWKSVVGNKQMNPFRGSVEDVGPCITSACGAGGGMTPMLTDADLETTKTKEFIEQMRGHEQMRYRIRKLTPRECFRLQGVDDADIDKLLNAGISNSQLYKCAGNSITVDVLYHIFRKAYIDKGCETIQPTLF